MRIEKPKDNTTSTVLLLVLFTVLGVALIPFVLKLIQTQQESSNTIPITDEMEIQEQLQKIEETLIPDYDTIRPIEERMSPAESERAPYEKETPAEQVVEEASSKLPDIDPTEEAKILQAFEKAEESVFEESVLDYLPEPVLEDLSEKASEEVVLVEDELKETQEVLAIKKKEEDELLDAIEKAKQEAIAEKIKEMGGVEQEVIAPEEIVEVIEKPKEEVSDIVSNRVGMDKRLEGSIVSMFSETSPVKFDGIFGDVYLENENGVWSVARFGETIREGYIVETGDQGEATIRIGDTYMLRLKANTKIKFLSPRIIEKFKGDRKTVYRFELFQGIILAAKSDVLRSDSAIEISTIDYLVSAASAVFRMDYQDENDPWISVLRGSATIYSRADESHEGAVVKYLEKISFGPGSDLRPVKLQRDEWEKTKEVYELIVKTDDQEQAQMDMSKRSGDFFKYVYDHGTFYTPRVGFALRDFYEDPLTREVRMRAEYDVFPENSFVGVYFLLRNLTTGGSGAVQFDARVLPSEAGYPEKVLVEFKNKGDLIKTFDLFGLKPEWKTFQFPFYEEKSRGIAEMVFVFHNKLVGEYGKGLIEFRNFKILPPTNEIKEQARLIEKTMSVPGRSSIEPASAQPKVVKKKPRIIKNLPKNTDFSKKFTETVPVESPRDADSPVTEMAGVSAKVVSLSDL